MRPCTHVVAVGALLAPRARQPLQHGRSSKGSSKAAGVRPSTGGTRQAGTHAPPAVASPMRRWLLSRCAMRRLTLNETPRAAQQAGSAPGLRAKAAACAVELAVVAAPSRRPAVARGAGCNISSSGRRPPPPAPAWSGSKRWASTERGLAAPPSRPCAQRDRRTSHACGEGTGGAGSAAALGCDWASHRVLAPRWQRLAPVSLAALNDLVAIPARQQSHSPSGAARLVSEALAWQRVAAGARCMRRLAAPLT